MTSLKGILFIRVWQTIYLVALVVSLLDRMNVFGWRQPVGPEVIPFNMFTIVVFVGSWVMLEKRKRFSILVARILSTLRMLATILNASVIFGFIIAFIPTGSFPWVWLIQLPTPVYITMAILIFALELLFFIQVGRVFGSSEINFHHRKSQ